MYYPLIFISVELAMGRGRNCYKEEKGWCFGGFFIFFFGGVDAQLARIKVKERSQSQSDRVAQQLSNSIRNSTLPHAKVSRCSCHKIFDINLPHTKTHTPYAVLFFFCIFFLVRLAS